ncbi:MAG: thiol peroxidase [Desulfobulbaceae bacterium]|uniref:Thiol peroxidase n=1 Tax=Candidatus Desulfatifera sulfidica TaxID=2841691 RepID=A0A8J6TDN5_9BACT|nr:thiol peroxidase [Candidatus Desulfatifera sulfidica]
MAKITLQGNSIDTIGALPALQSQAPAFRLTRTDLSDCILVDFAEQKIVMNIFPSIDTGVCAASVRHFNQDAGELEETVVLCISGDLPFAHQRFCEGEGLANVIPLSVFRAPEFGRDYGVTITSGPLTGLLSRAIIIIDTSGQVVYTEQVPEITQEPDYDAALKALCRVD